MKDDKLFTILGVLLVYLSALVAVVLTYGAYRIIFGPASSC